MSGPPTPHPQNDPLALSQVVLKLHSRCDLACDHCYVYEAADQSWRGRPMVISDEVIEQAGRRIADHAAAHLLPSVQVVLHGGEPLLAGPIRLRRVVTELRSALHGVSALDLRIHTNGVLLTEDLCELFAEYGVKIGISLDGDQVANDRHRRYADGRSSYDQVLRALKLLSAPRFRDLYAGLLCTIDIANDPLVVFESLMDLRPPRIDFLLPHATWDRPPVRTPGVDSEYADWLIAIFDRWRADSRPVQIRTFDSIMATLRGGSSFTEALGLGSVGLVVIETDGSYEQVDSLKAAYEGAPETGMNVFDHAIDAVARHPGIMARQQGIAALSMTCQQCPVVSSCGGGLYTHRYQARNGFDNPSVYCADLLRLISHVRRHRPGQAPDAAGIGVHAMNDADFRALAAGAGDAAAVDRLVEGQRSLLRGLLDAVYRAAHGTSAIPPAEQAGLEAAWSLLAALDREQPDALVAALGHPYLRVWAVRCLEQLRRAAAGNCESQTLSRRDLGTNLGYLGAVAAVGAARAGMGAMVTIPVIEAAVHLPALGRLVLGPEEGAWPGGREPEAARVSVITNAVIIRVGESCWTLDRAALLAGTARPDAVPGNTRTGDWQPVRTLRADGFRMALDDIDPYRDCTPWPSAPRLTAAGAARWQSDFEAAWQHIEREHTAYAAAMAAGLTTLTPLTAAADGSEASAVARHAFGAVAASAPAAPGGLALLLMQEFQHAKLGAILELYDLYNPDDDRLFPAPWGEGKGGIETLLQGAYTHLAKAHFWQVSQSRGDGPVRDAARRRSQECGAQAAEAIGTLLDSGALTPLGTRFVQEMRDTASAFSPADDAGHRG
jgi:uncharacterized protein